MSDTEVQQLIIYVGTQEKIDEARQAGTIGPDDFAVVTDAPDFALQSTVQAIQVLIPNQASAQNKLADKNYVDNSTLPSSTKYGASLTLSIDSSDYKVTATLKDQDGNTLGTQQVIDLPLESVVVGGSYDSVNKKIILTLQNGNTIDVPVGDLVAGLQTEITAQNKLSSDLVDDTNKTNKFVTTQEKTTWNNKQNAISDLETIRAGASAGATAVQPSAIANMQTTTNLVTSISSSSTDSQYPSAKLLFDTKTTIEETVTSVDNKKIDKGHAVNDFATNCITDIQQDVKLELSSNTVTLKSGSVVIIPSTGTQYQLTSDMSATFSTNGKYYIVGATNTSIYNWFSFDSCGTGPTLPSGGGGYAQFFNTTDLKYYTYDSQTSTWVVWRQNNGFLPVGIVSVVNGVASIEKVFNGFGYIGNVMFALPGVKALYPNGRNADGTLKVGSISLTSLFINDITYSLGSGYSGILSPWSLNAGIVMIQDDEPVFQSGVYQRWFSPKQNKVFYHTQSGTSWTQGSWMIFGSVEKTTTQYTKFDIRPVSGLSASYINTALGYTPIERAVDDNSTTSTTLGWSASKLNGIIGDIETTINTIRGV